MPVADFASIVRGVRAQANADNYIYPPLQHTVVGPLNEPSALVPRTERPALYYDLPATHRIEYLRSPSDPDYRRGVFAYLIHVFGFVLGYRCQFYDWGFDARVNVAELTDHLPPRQRVFAAVMNAAVQTWSRLNTSHRTVATNLFYVHSRAQVLEPDWERFLIQYMAFDAAYSVALALGVVSKVQHAVRFEELCARYGILRDAEKFKVIVEMRNGLIHQALWNDRLPGDSATQKSHAATIWLSGITRRVAYATLGLSGAYIRSSWSDMQYKVLDLDTPAA